MATPCSSKRNIQGHPCFGGDHRRNGRIHLAVAPRCTIKCAYCTRKHDCVNESRPGVASRILTPQEALKRVREVAVSAIIKVVGIAGPGDPLANEETFETFRLVGEEFPPLVKCLSTNGLLLPETVDRLDALGLGSLTITINALDPAVGARIYSHVFHHGKRYSGAEGASILIANQFEGLARAAALGMVVKVNTVLIPGINDGEIETISRKVKELGAAVMNVMPLIPQADMAQVAPPSPEYLEELRSVGERVIGQFRNCRQCRADAVGLIGEERASLGCVVPQSGG